MDRDRIFRRKSEQTPIAEPKAVKIWLSAFLLTLANPPTILIYLTFFSTVVPSWNFSPVATAVLPAGVFCGSFLWWVFLAGIAARMGKKLSPSAFRRINVASGLVLSAFGLWAVLKGFGVSM